MKLGVIAKRPRRQSAKLLSGVQIPLTPLNKRKPPINYQRFQDTFQEPCQ